MRILLFTALAAFISPLVGLGSGMETIGSVTVIACDGAVSRSVDGSAWEGVQPGTELKEGTQLRTGQKAKADLLLQYNGSVFRLGQDSQVRVELLRKRDTGVDMVTETRLKVIRGEFIGSQRKLHKPSILEIATAAGRAFIRGTEYVVNAEGQVTVLSGSVEVNYNLPGNKGSIKVTVPAGYTFNPATGTVVPTDPVHLQDIIADVSSVRNNAEVFKAGGATIVVKPNEPMSVTTPNGNNGVGNGVDPQPPGNPPVNDGPGTSPGNPGNKK